MQDVIAIAIAIACVWYAFRFTRRQFGGTSGCGSSGGKGCAPTDPSRSIKRTPLVSLGVPDDKSTK